MADTKEPSKPVSKGYRRASFARALHVPVIGRRKQAHITEHTDRISSPSQENGGNVPQRPFSPQPATISINARQVDYHDDEGAEIPDIPLRKSSNTRRPGIGYSGSRLAALEQMLAEGGPQGLLNDHHFGPTSPSYVVSRGNHRYSTKLTAFWEPPLHPQPRDSREHSLSDVPEASSASTIRNEADPSSELLDGMPLPPWRESRSAPESIATSIVSTQEDRSPSTYPRSSHNRAAVDPSIALTSLQTDLASPLPALQTKGVDEACDALEPVVEEDMEPGSFDLVVPAASQVVYNLERRSEQLFSVAHLRVIFDDPIFLHKFTNFVSIYRPRSVPLLRYYLDALKAIRAMEWVNGITSRNLSLDGHEFAANGPPNLTENVSLRQMSEAAFEVLARDELPAYITHVWTEIVEMSMKRRITGTLPAHLHDMSDGLAEVFCITDPSRQDNPIVFSSEEFHRTTQYGLDYVIGRNCRFLQGPKTNHFAVKRIREKLEQGKEHCETFLNYRRDGSPFMNLLMCAPLIDSTGTVRYFLGAQIDVSGLAKGCSGLESLRRLVDQSNEDQQRRLLSQETQESSVDGRPRWDGVTNGASRARVPRSGETGEDEFRLLCEMLNGQELETARRYGGRMHRSQQEQVQHLESMSNWHKRRVVIQDSENSPPATPRQQQQHNGTGPPLYDLGGMSPRTPPTTSVSPTPSTPPHPLPPSSAPTAPTPLRAGPRVPTIYEHYLVVRPYPSLRILFASPSLRVPGILQSHLMSRVGGSRRVHEELIQALAMGQGVTAKVRWMPGGGGVGGAGGGILPGRTEGRPRWIHCTPLIGSNGSVGVWVVVIVDEVEDEGPAILDLDGGGRRRRMMGRVGGEEVSPPTRGTRWPGRRGGGGGEDRDSSLWDSMSLNDFAAMNSLPEDEDLRQHVREMFGEVRRRDRGAARGGEGRAEWSGLGPGGREAQRVLRVRTDGVGGTGPGGGRDGNNSSRVAELRAVDGLGGSRSSSPYMLRAGESA